MDAFFWAVGVFVVATWALMALCAVMIGAYCVTKSWQRDKEEEPKPFQKRLMNVTQVDL